MAIVNDIFAANGKDGFAKFQTLKSMFPFSKILSSIQNDFGVVHKTLSLAINLLDEDHGLEVLAMSSLTPPPHEQDIMVYRGVAGEADEALIAFIFNHGYRTESSFNSNHYLFGYYVDDSKFTWKDIAAEGPSYDFGGTYVSISPSQAYSYALWARNGEWNGGFLLEMRQKAGEAKICGVYSDELIPSQIDAHNIKAIYRIDAEKLISAVYLNPNYITTANEPKLTYKIGDGGSAYAYNYNIYGINDFYTHIKCTELNPVHRYASADEFKAKFDAEALAQARAKMYADLEDTLDICLIPESDFS